MERDPKTLLFEIAESCRMIVAFTVGLDVDTYASNALIKSAVERQFIVIGEALNRLKQTDDAIFDSITDASQIVGFRNILVHGYDVVSDELVWEIISENVPILLVQCEAHLK
jgi:uncharacterized protein with HEPN domain